MALHTHKPTCRFTAFLLMAGLFCMLGTGTLNAQNPAIPTKGKDFWLGFMENFKANSTTEELKLFVSSDINTTGTLSMPLLGWSQNFAVTANVTTVLTVANSLAEHFGSEIISSKGIRVETADTVALFAINFESVSADGSKILPKQSLGTDYRINTYPGLSASDGYFTPEFLIVATEDDTYIRITPAALTMGGNPAGTPFVINLDQGESFQIKASDAYADLTGTKIEATDSSGPCRPFAVFSGSQCTRIPSTCNACDHIFDQNFSVDTWGTEYMITPFSFAYRYSFRILADENNTVVNLGSGATYTLQAGQYRAFNGQVNPACVTSNRPVSVIQLMEGVGCAGSGDPSMLILNSTKEMIDKVTFSTVASTVINQHVANVIMATPDTSQLELDGVPVSNNWTLFPGCIDYAYVRLTLTQGSHTLEADSGFTAYVYGTGPAESYAYSVGSFTPMEPLQPDSVICTDDTVRLGAPSQLYNAWWSRASFPNDTIAIGPNTTLYPPLITDIYILTGDHFVTGCTEQFLYSVEVTSPPQLAILADADTICQNQEIQLMALLNPLSAAYQYTWSPASQLNDPTIFNPIAYPDSSGWFSVLVETFSVCSQVEDSIYLEVKPAAIEDFDAITDRTQLCVGDSAQLDAQLSNVIFEDDFDPGANGLIWNTITNGTAANTCGSVSGNALYFNGPGMRFAETVDLDMSTGGYVEFQLKVGTGSFPCEDADPGMDIVLEYSVNSGASWNLMEQYAEDDYPLFAGIKAWLPPPARTPNTRFRFRQLANGGNNLDNWSIDNVKIGQNYYTGFVLDWTPPPTLSATNIPDPQAGPISDITYYLTATDTINGCDYSDSVSIQVPQPFTIQVPNDTTLCSSVGFSLPVLDNANTTLIYNWSPGNLLSDSTSFQPSIMVDTSVTFTVEVSDSSGCYTETGSVQITVTPPPPLTVSGDTLMCLGDSAQLLGVSSPGVTYSWSPAIGLSNPNIPNPMASPPSSMFYQLSVYDNNNCVTTGGVQILLQEPPSFELGNDTTVCEGESVTFDPGFVGTDFEWHNGSTSRTFTTNTAGTFWVTASNQCGSDTDTISLYIEPLPQVSLGPDLIRCERDTILLDAGNPGLTFLWTNGQTGQTLQPDVSGTYGVTVTSDFGCESYDEMNLELIPYPRLELGPDFVLCNGTDTVLDISFEFADRYLWQDGSTLPVLGISEPGTYHAELENICALLTDTVEVDFEVCECHFYVPTAFSPNGDGLNETFHPTLECNLEKMEMLIFNRWGQLIYSGREIWPGWEGTHEGQPVPMGVYPFIIRYSWFGPQGIEFAMRKGSVTVVR